MGFLGGCLARPVSETFPTFLAAKINMLEPRGQFGSRLQGGKDDGEAFRSGCSPWQGWHSRDGTYMNQDLYHLPTCSRASI